jgi:hypothetical protein
VRELVELDSEASLRPACLHSKGLKQALGEVLWMGRPEWRALAFTMNSPLIASGSFKFSMPKSFRTSEVDPTRRVVSNCISINLTCTRTAVASLLLVATY